MKATCKPGLRPLSEILWYPPACLTVNYSVLSDSLPSEEDLQESHSLSYVHLSGWCPVQPSSAQSEKEGTRAAWHPGAQTCLLYPWMELDFVFLVKMWNPCRSETLTSDSPSPWWSCRCVPSGRRSEIWSFPALTGVVGGKSDISLFSINCSWSNN